MEFKIFGKSLFEVKSGKGQYLLESVPSTLKASKYLPDFYTLGTNGSQIWTSGQSINDFAIVEGNTPGSAVAIPIQDKKPEKEVAKLTAKGVYQLEMLHEKTFELKTDPDYVGQQLESFKDKLALIKAEEFDMTRGVNEVASMVVRLENRKKYTPSVAKFYGQYPYTTTTKIESVVKIHDYLKLGQVAQFLADLPKEAVEAMKNYDAETSKLCEKKAVFYIIADKKDFEKTTKRRDPILLAQSPFGHFWQILGAWDKEMLFIEEL